MPLETDAFLGTDALYFLMNVYALTGEEERIGVPHRCRSRKFSRPLRAPDTTPARSTRRVLNHSCQD